MTNHLYGVHIYLRSPWFSIKDDSSNSETAHSIYIEHKYDNFAIHS